LVSKETPVNTDQQIFVTPRKLNIAARQVWDHHAQRIYEEGRWQEIDHDMLALYSETVELYRLFVIQCALTSACSAPLCRSERQR
jgi:phage terminase small subunit